MPDSISLSPAALVEVVLAFLSAYGALLTWKLPRYRALAHYFAFLAVLMVLNLLEASRTGFLFTPSFTLLKGPLLYLFVRAMVNEKRLRGLPLWLQFVPPLAVMLLQASPQLAILLGTASQLAYMALSFRLLHRYHRATQAFRSDAQSLRLTWLAVACGLIAVQAASGLLRLNLQPFLDPGVLGYWFIFDLLFLLVLCGFLLSRALRQQVVYDDMLAHEEVDRRPPPQVAANAAEARNVFAQLDALIVRRQLYRRPRLSVEDLAKETGLQVKDISWALNTGAKTSFNDYINRLRIEALKQQLLSSRPGRLSLLELAFDAGFNSKSSFNAIFKREVGLTPTQFMLSLEREGAVRSPAPLK